MAGNSRVHVACNDSLRVLAVRAINELIPAGSRSICAYLNDATVSSVTFDKTDAHARDASLPLSPLRAFYSVQ